MMRIRRLIAALACLVLPLSATAQSSPVVVELFTSQGCSSCPAADAFLAELAHREDVLTLAFHVDYWDRLGWPDTFGSPDNTNRQYAYARTFHNRSVWTPQFVVGGRDYSKGNFRSMVKEYVNKQSAKGSSVAIKAKISGKKLVIETRGTANYREKYDIVIVHFTPSETVAIKRGENAGRTIKYHNIVRSTYHGGTWNGRDDKKFTVPLRADPPVAVLVQEADTGPIMAAQVIR